MTMTPDDWQRVESLYHAALARPVAERAAFLRDACAGDDTVRREVDSLLAAGAGAESLLKTGGAWPRRALIGQRLGVYQVVSLLGAGGMGEVYRARDTRLDRDVAIKVLPPAFADDADRLARFTREAKTLAALNHPNIAQIYGIEGDALVMELVEGDDLSVIIAGGPKGPPLRTNGMPIAEALAIAKQIADALEAAHELGIVHRDLKPANIKVRADGTVKVLDFGLAKAMKPASGSDAAAALANSPTITTPVFSELGIILGTAAYMSPEQAAGKLVDRRSDVWSFGVVLFEMLTGHRLFAGETVSHVIAAVLKTDPDWTMLPAETPPAVRRLLRRCLEKDRRRRIADASDVRLELEDAASENRDDAATMTSTVAVIPAWRRALPWAVAGLLTVALASMVFVWSRAQSVPALTRMTIPLSGDNSLTLTGGSAISPDGRTVAFSAGSSGSTSLYVRRLEELEPHALPLTENGSSPFFSPDGAWLAFSRGGNLEKIPVAGGPAQVICKAGNSGGRWQVDGTIVFADAGGLTQMTGAALWRVASSGGTPELVARPVEGSGISYRWPEPLPGGGMLLTIIKATKASIAVLAPGSTTPRLLIESGNHARYLPTGHLVYVAREKLMAVPFDVRRLETRGSATVVVEGLFEDRGGSNYDASASGALIYQPTISSDATIVWRDRTGATHPVVTRPRGYQFPALSPGGDRLSVMVIEPGPTRNIWTGRLANEPLTRLTFGDDDWYGVWSRDGMRLFYTAFSGGAYNIFWISTDGSGKSGRLTESPHAQAVTSVSPDGDTLLFNDVDPKTRQDIWALSLSTNEARPIVRTPFVEGQARFSPDGRSIAYVSNETGPGEVYVQAYPGPGIRKQVSVDGGDSPFWSHSGRELFYRTAIAMFAVPILDAATLRVGAPQRLFSHVAMFGTRPSISADDQRFLLLEGVASVPSQLNLVQGWFEELKARVK